MLESIFLAMFGLGVFLLALTAFDKEEIAWPILSFVTWIFLSVTVASIELPSSYLLADNSVVDHVSTHPGGAFMQIFFLGFAIIFIVIFYNRVLDAYRESVKKKLPGGG